MTLFKHLWKSFENDKKLRQTIYSFACEEYVQKGNEYKEPKLLRGDLKSGMEHAAVKYESNIKIQNRQARRDCVSYGCLPYKKIISRNIDLALSVYSNGWRSGILNYLI